LPTFSDGRSELEETCGNGTDTHQPGLMERCLSVFHGLLERGLIQMSLNDETGYSQ
jgi:hypothetical protein